MDYLGSLMPMLTVNFQVLMLIFVVVLPLLYLPHTSIGGSRLLSIGIAADTVFLLMYHAWKKGREDD